MQMKDTTNQSFISCLQSPEFELHSETVCRQRCYFAFDPPARMQHQCVRYEGSPDLSLRASRREDQRQGVDGNCKMKDTCRSELVYSKVQTLRDARIRFKQHPALRDKIIVPLNSQSILSAFSILIAQYRQCSQMSIIYAQNLSMPTYTALCVSQIVYRISRIMYS